MAKLRHIALIVPDPDKAAKFFEEAFDMKVAGRARRGVYVSDGTINVALLKQEGNEKVGIYHFGMWVDDLDAAEKKVVSAGGKYLAGRPEPAAPGQAGERALLLRGQVQGPARHRVRPHPHRLDRRREGRGGREELISRRAYVSRPSARFARESRDPGATRRVLHQYCASRFSRWVPGLVPLAQERSLHSPGTRCGFG